MYLPPLQPINNTEIRICGDVDIHPSASIAPGVILQAMSNSRIVIGADACIGMGTIITACDGEVEIASGVTLGSGVLVVGRSQIGSNACIGTATTIFNYSVEPMKVVEPGSILGDNSRSPSIDSSSDQQKVVVTEEASVISEVATNGQVPDTDKQVIDPNELKEVAVKEVRLELEVSETLETGDPWQEKPQEGKKQDVKEDIVDIAVKEVKNNLKLDDDTTIGKVYIDQLLVTLFPHKKEFNKNKNRLASQDD